MNKKALRRIRIREEEKKVVNNILNSHNLIATINNEKTAFKLKNATVIVNFYDNTVKVEKKDNSDTFLYKEHNLEYTLNSIIDKYMVE